MKHRIRSTTILGVRRNGVVCMGGDGQVTFGEVTMKKGARKVRTMHEGKVVSGFAGSAADAFTLFEMFERHLAERNGHLPRAAVDMAKEWRRDRMLRRLDALLAVMDKEHGFVLSGEGDIIEPDDGIVAIGSGGAYATAAARALFRHSELGAKELCRAALTIAAEICIYSNDNIELLTIDGGV